MTAARPILALLFGHADRAYYVNEIVKRAGAGVSQVQAERRGAAKSVRSRLGTTQ